MMTRVDIEKNIEADDTPFTLPFWLAGLLVKECRRQGLTTFGYHSEGVFEVAFTVKITKKEKK
jgi:hypothetical protein